MGEIAIKVKGLGKQYRLGTTPEKYYNLRDAIVNTVKAPFKKFARLSGKTGPEKEMFWALKDVSFEVKHGEVLGIIGRNGAGKSTLLKILSRITEPTEGCVKLYGRVGSLLEVGTGFHPELTGRENIYLSGAILGMRKLEINRKFDEIVDFAGIEKFLDTPVKRYSSGMYVRLAFAVAAHLDPEILLVDEVLAVGDADFQKKCLGKMGAVAKGGRTVLFVSHNLEAVRVLSSRSILIEEGKVTCDELTNKVLLEYKQCLTLVDLTKPLASFSYENRRGTGEARFTSIQLVNGNGEETSEFEMWQTIKFKLSYQIFQSIPELLVFIGLRSNSGPEFVTSVKHFVFNKPVLAGQHGTIIIELPNSCIRPGEYPLYFWLGGLSLKTLNKAFDVVDDLTSPLVVRVNTSRPSLDIDPMKPSGYFSIPSRLIQANSQ